MPSSQKLIQELLDESIRARRRRLHITASEDFSLNDLGAVDAKLDKNISALAVFGNEALHACAQAIQANHPADRDAAVHLLCACALQMPESAQRDRSLVKIVQDYRLQHPSAVRDALWFFPAGLNMFDQRRGHLALLLKQARTDIQCLAITLIGRLGEGSHVPALASLLENPQASSLHNACELALARIGVEPPQFAQRIQRYLNTDDQARLHALRLVSTLGQTRKYFGFERYRALAKTPLAPLHRLAWCMATLSDPRASTTAILEDQQATLALQTRVMALAGHVPALIQTMGRITASPEAPSAAQRDLLRTVMGVVPVAAKLVPVDMHLRETEMRAAMLQCLRDTHVGVNNNADTCAWQPELILASDPGLRIRYGKRLNPNASPGIPPALCAEMSAPMRQALYLEQAIRQRGPFGFGLCAYANARQQEAVLDMAQWIEDNTEARA